MIRIGVIILPEQDWDTDRRRWELADSYGFDHAWTYDHLAWRTLADGPWHATVPTLVAAALTTSRVRLGTLVTTPNFRHPVPLAKELMTLDVMSHGRLHLALGVGAHGFDASVLGCAELTPGRRLERFAEFRGLLDRLLSQPVTDWSGHWYTAVDARMIPGPAQRPRPPFLIAAEGPRGMRLAASSARCPGDGWVTMGTRERGLDEATWWKHVSRTVERMNETVRGVWPYVRMLNMESGTASVTSLEHLRDRLGRAAELGFTDVAVAWPRKGKPFRGDESLLEKVAAELPALRRTAG